MILTQRKWFGFCLVVLLQATCIFCTLKMNIKSMSDMKSAGTQCCRPSIFKKIIHIYFGMLYIEFEAFRIKSLHFTNSKLSIIRNTPGTRVFAKALHICCCGMFLSFYTCIII